MRADNARFPATKVRDMPDDAGATPPLLELRDVSVGFGGLVALDEVSLEVHPGRILGVIGPNGAGKTTLFNVVSGFVQPRRGTLAWRGKPLVAHRPHDLARLGIARTLQGLGLFHDLTVLENVMVGAARREPSGFAAALLALPSAGGRERRLRSLTTATLDRLGIADTADVLPGRLPHGRQKKVALARALVAEPALLLLDEPAAGLSPAEIAELADLLRELRATTSVVLVEHHMDFVMGVCDEVAVLDFGKVIARGVPASVRQDPLVLAAYLGEEVVDA
jgi:branched-chain amino acid transport system ATP-binding protein